MQDAILEKCGEEGVVALHISVDRASRDGCVYLKCASQEDAGKAYRALHGWWFDSRYILLCMRRAVKYYTETSLFQRLVMCCEHHAELDQCFIQCYCLLFSLSVSTPFLIVFSLIVSRCTVNSRMVSMLER